MKRSGVEMMQGKYLRNGWLQKTRDILKKNRSWGNKKIVRVRTLIKRFFYKLLLKLFLHEKPRLLSRSRSV